MPVVMPAAKQAFFASSGAPLVGGRLYTYAAGTSTPKATFSDAAGTTPNANPVVLDARGEAVIYWSGAYKVELRDAANALVWTVDNVVAFDSTVYTPDGRTTLPSATTVDIGAATVRSVDISGVAAIQSFGSSAGDGAIRFVRFTGACSLVYNATSMILPGQQNIQCAANDTAIFQCLGGANWVCIAYSRATGVVLLPAGAVGTPALSRSTDTDTGIYFPNPNEIAASTGGVNAWTADASGNLTTRGRVKQTMPAFYARRTSGQTSGVAVIFDTEEFDVTSGYDNTTGIFTAPVAGLYAFQCGVQVNCTAGGTFDIGFSVNNSGVVKARSLTPAGVGSVIVGTTSATVLSLAANDNVRVMQNSGIAWSGTQSPTVGSFFSGHWVG